MTIEQLRERAGEQLKDFERQSVGVRAETFVETRLQHAVIFHFHSNDAGGEVEVVLDSDSGDFIQLSHTPGKPSGTAN